MKYHEYKLNKKYNVHTLKKFWYIQEREDEILIFKNNYIIFKKSSNIHPFLLSKINFCKRHSIKRYIILSIFEKICNKYDLPDIFTNILLSYIGLKDIVYYGKNKTFKFINYHGYSYEYFKTYIDKSCNKNNMISY